MPKNLLDRIFGNRKSRRATRPPLRPTPGARKKPQTKLDRAAEKFVENSRLLQGIKAGAKKITDRITPNYRPPPAPTRASIQRDKDRAHIKSKDDRAQRRARAATAKAKAKEEPVGETLPPVPAPPPPPPRPGPLTYGQSSLPVVSLAASRKTLADRIAGVAGGNSSPSAPTPSSAPTPPLASGDTGARVAARVEVNAQAAADQKRLKNKKKQGRAGTILTGGTGLGSSSSPFSSKKTVLGE